jgi:hypothetical protein
MLLFIAKLECSTPNKIKLSHQGDIKLVSDLGTNNNLLHLNEIKLVQQNSEIIGCYCFMVRKKKGKSEISCQKIW